jgi:hypothetical protein
VSRVADYRADLHGLPRPEWSQFLAQHSGLPGPRGNIELAQAFADESDPGVTDELLATDDEYLVFCGVIGLGRQLAETPVGDAADVADADAADAAHAADALAERLRGYAADGRWRVREAVAMALQRLGDADVRRLEQLVVQWALDDDPLVQRAAVAGICEPRLLADPHAAGTALEVCAVVTDALASRPRDRRRDPALRTLRQALGYCWSVAVAADPQRGLPAFTALGETADADVAWIVRENRRKHRLARLLQQGEPTASPGQG